MNASCGISTVPTRFMRADGLTKKCRKLREELAAFCMLPLVTLVAPEVPLGGANPGARPEENSGNAN